MYNRIRIVTTKDSSHELMKLFIAAFEKYQHRKDLPVVVQR